MSGNNNEVDQVIVSAAIHPGIGIARVGDAQTEFYIGPEITDQSSQDPSFYRDASGALKREAARFRIYGYNAAGEVVTELNPDNADIQWSAHLANSKADWFQFITAMDVPETKDLTLTRRNPTIKKVERQTLIVDPSARTICGKSTQGEAYAFNNGRFKGWDKDIYLGELQTDDDGRLLVLGGHGVSISPEGKPPMDLTDSNTFNNADDWFDDVSDGPVDATVSIGGNDIPVKGSWVVVAPPNYAPDVVGWRTMYDLLNDVYVNAGWLPVPETTSFARDVFPQLQRLSNLQWVNKGFHAMFGRGRPMDFNDQDFIAQLEFKPTDGSDPYKELRQQLLNAFRPHQPKVNEPRLWPPIYGDTFDGSLFAESPRTMLALPSVQQLHLQRWVAGDFVSDWDPNLLTPNQLSELPLATQPAMLDKAALHYCLADAFHPGCEMTWPMRHATMYSEPFRIRRRNPNASAPDYGSSIDQQTILSVTGPLHGQVSGDISRWMGLPWQGDTAYCRAGYDKTFDEYLPTFWPARVPNTVLTEEDYGIVINTDLPREQRIAAYSRRASWYRFIDVPGTDVPERMERMIAHFGAQGIVESRPGVEDDPVFPSIIYVENLPPAMPSLLKSAQEQGDKYHVWGDDDHMKTALAIRARKQVK